MTARSPSAFFLSVSLHGLIVALILFFTYLVQTQVKDVPKVMELVAGAGDNYGATEAPALGTPGGVKVTMPEPPAPQPAKLAAPAPVAPPEPEPVVTKAPVQKAVTPPKTTETKIPDLAKSVKRIEAKRRAKIEAKDRAAREAEQKRLAREQANTANRAMGVKHIDAEGIATGVTMGTGKEAGAGGKALRREEGDLHDAYFSLVKQKLRDGLEKPPGLSDTLTAVAEFQLNADGSISGARITRSSGSDEFDRAVMDDIAHFRAVRPPSTWTGDAVSLTFRMKEEDGG